MRWPLKPPASRLFAQSFIQGADQRKHQSSASLAFVRGNHRGPGNSPHKWPVTRKMCPFNDVIMTIQSVTLYIIELSLYNRKCFFINIAHSWNVFPLFTWKICFTSQIPTISYPQPLFFQKQSLTVWILTQIRWQRLLIYWLAVGWISSVSGSWLPGPRLNIKTVLSTYGDFHVKDKTAARTSYL